MSGVLKAPALHPLNRYYQLHARLYDATRWSFLFGRNTIIERIAALDPQPQRILEIGCGTGKNLLALRQRLPCAQLTGLDLSGEMLAKARKRLQDQVQVRLCNQLYDAPLASRQGFDLVLFSYTLSMINPGWDHVLRCAQQDLSPGGRLAVVDFAASPVPWFKRWMQLNHVCMEDHLAPELQHRFRTEQLDMRRAYGGLWQYLLFIGQRDNAS